MRSVPLFSPSRCSRSDGPRAEAQRRYSSRSSARWSSIAEQGASVNLGLRRPGTALRRSFCKLARKTPLVQWLQTGRLHRLRSAWRDLRPVCPRTAFDLALLFIFVSRVGMAINSVLNYSYLLRTVANRYRGRVFATIDTFTWSMMMMSMMGAGIASMHYSPVSSAPSRAS